MVVNGCIQTLKTSKDALEKTKPITYKPLHEPNVQLPSDKGDSSLIELNWSTGLVFGRAQNLARELMETPANILTPTTFCDRIKKEFDGIPKVEIHVRDRGSQCPLITHLTIPSMPTQTYL